jgi:hypothetical protein
MPQIIVDVWRWGVCCGIFPVYIFRPDKGSQFRVGLATWWSLEMVW